MHELGLTAPHPCLVCSGKLCKDTKITLGRLLPFHYLLLEGIVYRSVRNTVSADSSVSWCEYNWVPTIPSTWGYFITMDLTSETRKASLPGHPWGPRGSASDLLTDSKNPLEGRISHSHQGPWHLWDKGWQGGGESGQGTVEVSQAAVSALPPYLQALSS